jgi:ribosomal protein S18 acetylase RimI-like enzyme
MTPALQLEILDLRHFSAASLRPLLEAESRLWSERLEWDYRTSADLLLQYLDSRLLPGYVAIESGRVAGYLFCVYEERKAVIGDVFAIQPLNSEATPTDIELRLLESLIELLQNSPGVERIESQLLLHPHGLHAGAFRAAGFQVYNRLFMRLDLSGFAAAAASRSLPDGLVMRSWREDDFNAAAHLISDAYEGHLDSHINDQYRTVAGSLRFLHNIVRFPGCGLFDAAASRVLVHSGSHEVAAILLCSRVREDVAHVTQLCVARDSRSHGVGSILIDDCATHLKAQGFRALTLTVTEANQNAVALYRREGFGVTRNFDAMLWERNQLK